MRPIFAKNIAWRFIWLLGFWLLLGCPEAHTTEVLERRISVNFQQTPLKAALDEVARQGQFEWSYHAGIIAAGQPVTLVARDWTVRQTLYALLGEGYEFKPNGNYLILKKRRRPAEELSGYVTDPRTGQRLANATVYDRRTLRATTTDENGFYQLKKVDRRAEIIVAKLGYRDTVLQINSNSPRFQNVDLQNIAVQVVPREPTFWDNLHQASTKTERFFAATLDRWHERNVRDSLRRHFQVSLLPVVGTNHVLSGQVENDWSLNILAGHSRAVRKVEIAGLGNFTREKVHGLQVAGLFNLLRGDNRGVQIAGLVNRTRDTLQGVQIAGLINQAGHTQGLQIAGLVNRTRDTLQGGQIAGLVNTARQGNGRAGQLAGLSNVVRSGSANLQIAGLANAADTLQGVQVAGLTNRAHRARGLQIALFNSADELDGLQIGLLNRSGRRWLPILNW